MSVFELLALSIGLSMDAFSVSICKGLSMKRLNYIQALIISGLFGIFQAGMPLIGFWIVRGLESTQEYQSFISVNAGLIAFVLLVFLGVKMIVDAVRGKSDKGKLIAGSNKKDVSITLSWLIEILLLAIATSIDAMMSGFAFAIMQIDMVVTVTVIGVATFVLSFVGVFIGHFFGAKWEKPASIVGGCVLCLLGLKFLLSYFGLL